MLKSIKNQTGLFLQIKVPNRITQRPIRSLVIPDFFNKHTVGLFIYLLFQFTEKCAVFRYLDMKWSISGYEILVLSYRIVEYRIVSYRIVPSPANVFMSLSLFFFCPILSLSGYKTNLQALKWVLTAFYYKMTVHADRKWLKPWCATFQLLFKFTKKLRSVKSRETLNWLNLHLFSGTGVWRSLCVSSLRSWELVLRRHCRL